MRSDAVTLLSVREVIEAIAAACGLEEARMPSDAPGLVLEGSDGLITLIGPHPTNQAMLSIEIEAADASPVADGAVDDTVAERALEAMFELGGALEERSDWRLGLDGEQQFVLSAALELGALADTEQALAMIEEGQARARALAAAWEGLLRHRAA